MPLILNNHSLLKSLFVCGKLGHLLSRSEKLLALWGLAALLLGHLLDKQTRISK